MKVLYSMKYVLAVWCLLISGMAMAQTQTHKSVDKAYEVSSFPFYHKITEASKGGSASGMGGSCHTLACCSVWVYKVTIPTAGSIRIDNFGFSPLSGSAIAYRAKSAANPPTTWSNLTYAGGPGNFCGYRDTMVLGWHYTWKHPRRTAAQNARHTVGWRSSATDTVGPGSYYILVFNTNNQANIGSDTATLWFRFAPYCGGTTGRTCPPKVDIKGNDNPIASGSTTVSLANNTLFDSVSIGSSKTVTYSIENSSDSFFTLTGTNPVSVSGASAFSVVSQPSDRSIDNTDSTTFQIKYEPTDIGNDTAIVKIANSLNDTFRFTIIGKAYDFRPIVYAQKFEGTAADNWPYTPDPAKYATETDSVIAGSEDIWDIIREFTGDIDGPYDGRYFWGTQDLRNSNGGRFYAHHLNFDNVYVANLGNPKLKFNYYSVGFDSSDSLFYEVYYDNVGQGKVFVEKNSQAWMTVRLDIPSNIDSFKFVWSAYNDGSTDYSGFDGLEIKANSGPSFAIDSITVDNSPACSNSSNGKATAYVSGGTRPYTYAWQGISTTDSFITNVSAGTYYLTVTDANSSTVTDSVKINGPAALSPISKIPVQTNTTLSGVYGGWLDNSTGIVESNPSTFVFAGQTSSTDHRGWVKFDISSIPAGSQVDSIVLELYCNRANGSGTLTLDINSASDVEGPYGSPNTKAYTDFGNGTYTTVAVTGVGTYSNINLGANASSDLEDQLANGYFQIALDNHNNTDWKRFTSNLCNIKVYYIPGNVILGNLCYGEIADTINTIDSASGGSGSYAYFWEVSSDLGTTYSSANGKNDSIYYIPTDVLTDTTYYRRRVVDLNCSDTVYNDPAKFFVADKLMATLALDSNASTLTSTDGGATVTPSGGVVPYSYSWSNNTTSATATGLSMGWHTVTVTDKYGCIYVDSIEIKRRYALDLAVTNHVSCNGLSDAIATATVEGGVAPITIEWSSRDTGTTVDSLAAGWYYVTAYDANQDTLRDSIIITEPAVLSVSTVADSNVTCYGLSNGGATASVTGGTMPYTYSWNNNVTTASVTGITSGRYTITVTDKNNCQDTASIVITQPDSIALSIIVDSNVTCNGLSDGGATANVSGGTMPYTYLWNNNATTASITGLGAGTYSVTITDANGCTNKRQAGVFEPATLTATVNVDSNVTCNGDLSGAIEVMASGGNFPYNYSWSNSATTARLSKVAAGQYSVTVTDAKGCTDSDGGTVTEPSALTAGSITGDDVVCSGVAPNKITEVGGASGGTGSLAYQWQMSSDNSNWTDISGATSSEYQPMGTAGNTWYRRAVTDANNCGPFVTNTVKITINGQPQVGFTTTAGCEGKQTFFTDTTLLSSGKVASYAWRFGDKGTSTQQNPINVYKNSGSYTVSLVVITDSGCVDSTSKTVSVNPVPTVNFTSTAVCEGTATDLTNKSSIRSGTLSYSWNLGDKNTSTATSPSYTYTNAGYYTVQLTATSDKGCMDSISKTVQVKQVARPNFSATSVCEGNNTTFTNLSTNASSYSWAFGDGSGTSSKENPTYKYTSNRIYTAILTATSADGCSDTAHKKVSVYGLPTASFSATEVCLSQTTDFTNSSSGASNYQWVFGNGTSSNKTTPSLVYGSAGSYTVELTASTSNGCTDVSTVTVAVNALPEVSFTTSDICLSKDLTITNNTTGASSYAWTFGDGSGSASASPTHTYTTHGTYNVLLVATTGKGCVDSAKTNINAYAVPKVSFTANNECFGTDMAFTNTSKIAVGSMTYTWTLGDGNTSGNPSPSYAYTKTGTYNVKLVAASNNGCKDSSMSNVTVYTQPVINFTTSDICQGDALTTTNSSTGGGSYTWSFGDGNTSSTTSPTHNYAAPGKYLVKLEALTANGCYDVDSMEINAFAEPKVAFSANNECFGTDIKFTNSSKITIGTMTYNWTLGDGNTSGNTSPSYAYTKAGTYTVKLVATSNNGCKDSTTSNVTVYTQPVVNFTTSDICQGDALTTTNSSTGGGSYTWSFGDGNTSSTTSPTHNYAAPGKYLVKLEALTTNGCYDVDSVEINAFAEPKVAFSANNECFGTDIKFTNSSKIAIGTMTYNWTLGDGNTSGNTSPSYAYTKTGTYTVKLVATSNNGCKDSTTSNVTVYTQPVVNFTTSDICQGDALTTTNSSTGGGSYTWSFGDGKTSSNTSPTHNYATPGKYLVKLEAITSNGCYDTDSVEINAFAEPRVAFSAGNVCFGNAVDFINKSKIAAGTMTYVWDLGNGSTTGNPAPSYNYGKDGSYTVKLVATSNNGCKDSTTNNVAVYAMPMVDFSAANVCYGQTMTTTNKTTGAAKYDWSFGDGMTSTTTSPSNFYKKAGNYTVQLIATTSNNCVDSMSKTVSIYAKPIAGFDAKDVCDETAVSFANNSYNANITSHNWNFGDGNTSAVINPNYTYATAGSYSVTLITISDNGCSDTLSKAITIYPNPVVSFTHTTACDYDSTRFTNTTTIASGTLAYDWNFSTGDRSSRKSPAYKFPQAGAYVVGLKAMSDKGCERATTATIMVNPSPKAGIKLADNCEEQLSQFASISTLSKGKISSYNWDLGDGATSVDMNPTHLYSTDGTYNISLVTISDMGCSDTALTSITIFNKPTANFSSTDVCYGKPSAFTNQSVDAQDYVYDFGDKWGISILPQPVYTYEAPGSYSATLYVTSAKGCKDTITKTITIFALPQAMFSANNHCFGETFMPKDNSKGTIDSWNWNYDNGDSDNGVDPVYTYAKDGNYKVRLVVTDNHGCVDSIRKAVTVWPLPAIWVSHDTMVSKGYEVQLEARGGVAYKWNPVENLDKPLSATPIATVVNDITYTVTAANEFGCTKDTTVTLREEDDYTLEPSNIMTPDGNGQNDNWIVDKAQYYNDVEVIVFDRWGRIVFQSKHYDNQWNGVSQTTGEALPDGAYYYIVKVPAERDEYKGSITIFR